MSEAAQSSSDAEASTTPGVPTAVPVRNLSQQIVEIVSDSGEGAQTAGLLFGTVCAKMGNGLWTVEIIPAEIEPPARSRAGASGIRIRFGNGPVANIGDQADLVVAFNEQVLYGRIDQQALGAGTVLLIDGRWGSSEDAKIREAYERALEDFHLKGYDVREIPIHDETARLVENPRRGKNMWVVGLLCALHNRDLELAMTEVRELFRRKRKGEEVIAQNHALLRAGYDWAIEHLDMCFDIPSEVSEEPRVVMSGNSAIAMGCMAAGIEVCSMYPITPATSVSHFLAADFHKAGGVVHQAEDEIAAVGFALGASYSGKTAITITSGPGMALKTELLGLAVMAEIPLVVVDVQRGGPATGLPTKVEQGDLLHAYFGQPGDAPKIIMAPSSHEECFHFMVTARQLAESFRTPVFVLSDANLATAQACFPRPELNEDWLSPPVDQAPWKEGAPAYDWDPETGLSPRPIPGQPGGAYVLTGLAHDEESHIAYESAINQHAMQMRSRKLAALQKALRPPQIHGDEEGELLVVGWGSTRGAIEEAVDRLRKDGVRAGAICLRFLSPMEPGLKEIFARYRRVMTVEINYSDDLGDPVVDPSSRRYSQLAWLLRAATLVDVDCWSRVPGQPLPPQMIEEALRSRLEGAA
ncbi:MAG: 2-oxoacid:acceptor oxidoreductase subunit alpha [Deltaproteobacteria bacterium]|nr:2-oxoacid:acceptor oxidoreductase subunit alpha [Deltaproteobacteria bacterium]MBW2418095.1 2-oxoacid:acceptor oxidoreductase subunit alpha [Deltaproteobacteria bacterium]